MLTLFQLVRATILIRIRRLDAWLWSVYGDRALPDDGQIRAAVADLKERLGHDGR